MKKITVSIIIISISFSAYCQKEIWCYKVNYNYVNPEVPNANSNDGQIIKVPLEGGSSTPTVVHTFDVTGLQGKFPLGRLLQAANGKVYGITSGYTNFSVQPYIETLGVLFEYDLLLNKYSVLANNLLEPRFGVIELLPGFIYGVTNRGRSIFKYTIATNSFSIVATIPVGSQGSSIQGELTKASDGNLYFLTEKAYTANGSYPGGGIFKFNPLNNQLNLMYILNYTGGYLGLGVPSYNTKIAEGFPGKLYFTTLNGGVHTYPSNLDGCGTLCEYIINTNSVSKKYDFDYFGIGGTPSSLINGGNNKLYGALYSNPSQLYPNYTGSIFEYDLITNLLSVIYVNDINSGIFMYYYSGIQIKGSDGNIYGQCRGGIYKYDLSTNTISQKIPVTYGDDTLEPIEICRKPSYQEFIPNNYNPCVNTPFTYNINNTNATTYVWKKDGIIVPLQTTGILNINNLIPSDTGIYTCTMTNECGETTTMNLNITVNCLDVPEVVADKNTISLYPNPTKNTISIHLPESGNYEVQDIYIVNLLGQNVINNIKNPKNIAVSSLQKGIYIVVLKTNNGDWNGKFVKE
ncbi:T9SS type A sorting domain-containing protein [Flavobacterium sp.]|uniref:T9SS type A sorting domain-containing protein n=1 Tax=Flavobacterium sp. TaxID=239 RepID=UPI003753C1DD